jgi:hypothetical protein
MAMTDIARVDTVKYTFRNGDTLTVGFDYYRNSEPCDVCFEPSETRTVYKYLLDELKQRSEEYDSDRMFKIKGEEFEGMFCRA